MSSGSSIAHRLLALGLAAGLLALAPATAATAGEPAPVREGPTPVVVCGSHHRVIVYWLRAVAEGRLPASGITIVHFDAHPDLAVPARAIPAEAPTPARAADRLEIASFQLAAAWWGLVERVVWVRPDWAFQLADGPRRFRVGLDEHGLLRVDDPSDYWVLDGAHAPTEGLQRPRTIEVLVVPLSEAAARRDLARGPTVLDIDLDGFATRNPGADRLRAAGAEEEDLVALRRAFDRDRLALPAEPAARVAALDALLAQAERAATGGPVDALRGAWGLWWAGVELPGILALHRLAGRSQAEPRLLLEAGRDLVGLPEKREATDAEIQATADALARLVGEGAVDPALVTVARSVHDGFTPAAVWPQAEVATLRALGAVLGGASLHFDTGLRPVWHGEAPGG